MTTSEKLVLSGGVISRSFIETAVELSGLDSPNILCDLSPRTNRAGFEEARAKFTGLFEAVGCASRVSWLQDDFVSIARASELQEKVEAADVLVTAGGSTERALQTWEKLGLIQLIGRRVQRGQLVGCGASAGALVWAKQAHSDSPHYMVEQGGAWDYSLLEGTGVLPAWMTVHYSDTDNLYRSRKDQFEHTLRNHAREWRLAIGLETYAALVCIDGVGRAFDVRSGITSAPQTAHVYLGGVSGLPIALMPNDSIDLRLFGAS